MIVIIYLFLLKGILYSVTYLTNAFLIDEKNFNYFLKLKI